MGQAYRGSAGRVRCFVLGKPAEFSHCMHRLRHDSNSADPLLSAVSPAEFGDQLGGSFGRAPVVPQQRGSNDLSISSRQIMPCC